MPSLHGMLAGAVYDLCPHWDGNAFPTYGAIARNGPIGSALLPVDENGEDVLTRVTKKYLAADEELQKGLDRAVEDYFNSPLIYRVGDED